MPIYASSGKKGKFEPCPAGPQVGVLVDVIDLGMKETAYGQKHKVRLVWQTSELMTNDKPFVVSREYNLSLNEKATLRKDLESWRGKKFTDTEAEAFDLETLLGINGTLNVIHTEPTPDGKIWANVLSIAPMMKGMPRIKATPDYVRVCDRDALATQDAHDEAGNVPDESVPF